MLIFDSHLDGYFDVSDQMIDHLRRRAERCFRRCDAERDAIKTVSDFERYRERMRQNFLRAIGGLPRERLPLDAAVTGVIDGGEYLIEKTLYYSLPNFPVTAALYIPKSRRASKQAGPAVLFVCGHDLDAKAGANYQKVCIDLALAGFVVLAVDPVGQAERMQFIDEQTGAQRVTWGTTEHTHAGIPFYAIGSSIARYFVWDGIRGVDYLLTRSEVDPRRIGVTGNSGGGVQSAFLMLAEPRLAAAMPCTFIMDYESYLKSGQPQDAEQNLYGCFADGPDHDDYITAIAPRPVHLGLAAYDFFPIEGALASFAKAQKVYSLYGANAAEGLGYTIAPTTHCFSSYLRHAAVKFFTKTLGGTSDLVHLQSEPPLRPVAELNVTKTGQVLTSIPNCKTITQLLREEAKARIEERTRDPQQLRRRVAEVLGIGENVADGDTSWTGPARQRPIYPRVIFNEIVNAYRTEKIFFFSEPDICVTAMLTHPRDATRAGTPVPPTSILLFPNGTDAIPKERARIVSLLEQGKSVCVCDVRGIGGVKSRPITSYSETSKHSPEFRMAVDAMKMKTSTLGLRVFDLLRIADYLSTRSDCGPLEITGVGPAAIWAVLAGALDERFASVTMERSLLSLRSAAECAYYDDTLFNFSTVAWGLLEAADIIDLLPAIAPREFKIVTPLSATGVPMTREQIEIEFLRPAENAVLIGPKVKGWRPEI